MKTIYCLLPLLIFLISCLPNPIEPNNQPEENEPKVTVVPDSTKTETKSKEDSTIITKLTEDSITKVAGKDSMLRIEPEKFEDVRISPRIVMSGNPGGDGRIITVSTDSGEAAIGVVKMDDPEKRSALVKDKIYVLSSCRLGFYSVLPDSGVSDTIFVDVRIDSLSGNPNYSFLPVGNPNGRKVLMIIGQDIGLDQFDPSALVFGNNYYLIKDPNTILLNRDSYAKVEKEKISLATHLVLLYVPKKPAGIDSCLNDLEAADGINVLLFYFHGNRNFFSVPSQKTGFYGICDFNWNETFREKVRKKFAADCIIYSVSCSIASDYEKDDNVAAEALSFQINRPLYASSIDVNLSPSSIRAFGDFHLIEPSSYNESSPCFIVYQINL